MSTRRRRDQQKKIRVRNSRRLSKRRFALEPLEVRAMLAAYISEVQYDTLFGNDDIDQYVELRGQPNATIPNGTYFATVEGWGAYPGGPGYIHSLIDVSNLSFGSNGFLTILQAGHTYQVDPASTRLTGTGVGFSGLPNNRWTDASTISDRLAHVSGSVTFLLIQTSVKPVVGSDADANDDGLFDGPAASWTILDSVSLMGFSSPGWSYGRITFSELTTNHNYPPGTLYTVVDNVGYVARIGSSTGYGAEDWVSGIAVENNFDATSKYRFTYGAVLGDPSPTVFAGRPINHIGTYNFGGGYVGFVGLDTNGDGHVAANETPLPGVTVFADSNGSGLRDSNEVRVIASEQVVMAELANRFPNATLTITDPSNKNSGFAVRTVETTDLSGNSIRVFSHEGVGFLSTIRKMKVMFSREADSVSVQAIAAETLKPSFGRMELYDRNNNLLQVAQTLPLFGTTREVLTVARPQADIKYAVIYTNDNMPDSSPFGKFDKLIYSFPEYQDTSDALGRIRIEGLDPGNYSLVISDYPGDKIPLDSNSNYPLTVTKSEHRIDPLLGFRQNQLPEVLTTEIFIAENPVTNAIVGQVVAFDPDPGQALTYRIVGPSGPFSVVASTGQIRFTNSSSWNYETASPILVTVEVTDSMPIAGKTSKTITLVPVDVNEAPTIPAVSFSVNENSAIGTVVGTIAATDPDQGINGQIRYSLGSTNPAGVFAIDPITGVITVNNGAALDFESRTSIVVPVIATDRGTPPASATRSITIQVRDVNEAPTNITFTSVTSVPENASSGTFFTVATINVVDDLLGANALSLSGPDADSFSLVSQSLRFRTFTPLDFETKPTFTVFVSVDDPTLGSTPDATATFTLQITDFNERPTGILFNNAVGTISESTDVSTAVRVADLQAIDDALGANFFSLSTSLDGSSFSIVGNELRFRSGAPLDFETKNLYRVIVQVDDASLSGFPDASATFSISISDANEPPQDIQLSNVVPLIQETNGVSAGQAVATIAVIDDALGANQWSVGGPDTASFEVVGDQLRLKPGAPLNFEVKPSYSVTVIASDPTLPGSTPATRALAISIGNRPEVISLTTLQGTPLSAPLTKARLTWDMQLGTIAPDAISVRKKDLGNVPVTFLTTRAILSNRTIVDLEFTGSFVGPDGLIDGLYEITVDGSKTTALGSILTGLNYGSGDYVNWNPPTIGSLNISGPAVLLAGQSVNYQLTLSGVSGSDPQPIEYSVDFQGDSVIDRTVSGGVSRTLDSVSYPTAGAYTMMITAKRRTTILARSSFVVNVSPETTVNENWLSALDVDRDNTISPLDPLVIINRLNSGSSGSIPYTLDYDVDRDGSLSPLDILTVINHLNTPSGSRVEEFTDLLMAESGGFPAITNNRGVSGKILSSTRTLFASLNGGEKKDVSEHVASDGTFQINDTAIAQLFGTIPDGPHMLSLMTKPGSSFSTAMDKRFLQLSDQLKAFSMQSLVADQGNVRVGWSNSAPGASYHIWVGLVGATRSRVRTNLAGTLDTFTLSPGTYEIQVEATDSAGNSRMTELTTFTVN
ncbi:MAG: cadherin domain-containing protein [Planctomycetota bacterium]|jgi:hypothetical protein